MSFSDFARLWDLLVSEASETSVGFLEDCCDRTLLEENKSKLAKVDRASQTIPCDMIDDTLLSVTGLEVTTTLRTSNVIHISNSDRGVKAGEKLSQTMKVSMLSSINEALSHAIAIDCAFLDGAPYTVLTEITFDNSAHKSRASNIDSVTTAMLAHNMFSDKLWNCEDPNLPGAIEGRIYPLPKHPDFE